MICLKELTGDVSSRHLDLSLESHRPSSFQLDFSFGGLKRLSSFDFTRGH